MNVLVIDIGGTNIKMLVTGETEPRRFPSGKGMTPVRMVADVKQNSRDWQFDVVSIGYPGVVKQNIIMSEPHNLAPGWKKFDFEAAFDCPVKIMNDAAMQALGCYKDGLLLFFGFGTGLGSALVANNVVVPMELGKLSYNRKTYAYYLGSEGYQRLGLKKWQKHVEFAVQRVIAAVNPDDVVLGGGNAKKLKTLPPGCRLGHNKFAFAGGFLMWKDSYNPIKATRKRFLWFNY